MPKTLMDELFGDEKIDIDCSQCQSTFRIKLKEILQGRNTVRCPNCQKEIELNLDEKAKKTLRETNKATQKLEKTLKDFEKTLKKFGK